MDSEVIITRKQAIYSLQSNIIRNVVQYATSQGLSQMELCRRIEAKGCKMLPQTLYKLNKGIYTRQLGIYTLTVICEAVGKSLFDLLEVKPLE